MKDAAGRERMALEQDQRISETVEREQSRLRNFIRRRLRGGCGSGPATSESKGQ